MQITGIARGSQVVIVCSECGPVALVEPKWAPLRMLAHYHRHETEAAAR